MIKLVENNAGPGVEEFEWSTSEQVWPFEKFVDGSTLYCKEIDFGALPNNGTKTVNHNISGFLTRNLFRYDFVQGDNDRRINHFYRFTGGTTTLPSVRSTTVEVKTVSDLSGYIHNKFRLIYKK